MLKKIVLFIPALIGFLVIGILVIPFSLGRIYKGVILCLPKWFMFLVSFTLSAIFLLLYILTLTKVEWFMLMAVSFDQLGNTSINGNQDNTVSGRLGYKIKIGESNGAERLFCKILSMFDPTTKTHCISSIENDEVNKV